jgi:hypothetical protein
LRKSDYNFETGKKYSNTKADKNLYKLSEAKGRTPKQSLFKSVQRLTVLIFHVQVNPSAKPPFIGEYPYTHYGQH